MNAPKSGLFTQPPKSTKNISLVFKKNDPSPNYLKPITSRGSPFKPHSNTMTYKMEMPLSTSPSVRKGRVKNKK